MKSIILPAVLLLSAYISSAQKNVGIGTVTPSEKLQVIGNIKADTIKGVSTDLTLPFRKTQPTDGSPLVQISNTNTSGGTAMYILANSSGAATAIRGESTTGTAGRFITTSGTAGIFTSTTGKAIITIGDIKFTGIGETNKAVLTSDANGNATWSNKLFFKAQGSSAYFYPARLVYTTIKDWASFPININANSLNLGGLYVENAGRYFVFKKGIYRVSIKISVTAISPPAGSIISLQLYKNTDLQATDVSSIIDGTFMKTITTILSMDEQDFVEFKIYHTSDGLTFSPSGRINEFTIEKLD